MPEHNKGASTAERPGPRARAGSQLPKKQFAASHLPRYFISIAADIACVHPRTLRIYEDEGLLSPHRRNRLRLYSDHDLEQVRLIRFLTRQQGVNLAGVRIILKLHELGHIDIRQVYPVLTHPDTEAQ